MVPDSCAVHCVRLWRRQRAWSHNDCVSVSLWGRAALLALGDHEVYYNKEVVKSGDSRRAGKDGKEVHVRADDASSAIITHAIVGVKTVKHNVCTQLQSNSKRNI